MRPRGRRGTKCRPSASSKMRRFCPKMKIKSKSKDLFLSKIDQKDLCWTSQEIKHSFDGWGNNGIEFGTLFSSRVPWYNKDFQLLHS